MFYGNGASTVGSTVLLSTGRSLDDRRAGKQILQSFFSPNSACALEKTNTMTVQDGCRTTEPKSCKEEDSVTMTNYDDTVAFLGQWGRFQRVVFFLLCASIVPNGFGAFTLVFLTDTQTHQCLVPDVNLTEDWRETIIPATVSSCRSSFAKIFNCCAHKKQSAGTPNNYRNNVTRYLLIITWYIPVFIQKLLERFENRCV